MTKISSLLAVVTVTVIQLIDLVKNSQNIRCPDFYRGLYKEEDIHQKFVSIFDSQESVTFDKT